MRLAVLAGFLLAGPVLADERLLTGEDFAKAVTGRTFFYTRDGQSFGAEQYLPGHKVVWAFTGEDCEQGEWFANGDDICFTYEGRGDVQCWRFRREAGGLTAESLMDAGTVLIARQSSPEPMRCLGPDVGA